MAIVVLLGALALPTLALAVPASALLEQDSGPRHEHRERSTCSALRTTVDESAAGSLSARQVVDARPAPATGLRLRLALDLVAPTSALDDLPGLSSNSPVPAGLGSTGRSSPLNLTEQLAMTEVRNVPAGSPLTRIVMGDAWWSAADGWVKMRQVVNGVDIHYVMNTVTGAVDDFKFAG